MTRAASSSASCGWPSAKRDDRRLTPVLVKIDHTPVWALPVARDVEQPKHLLLVEAMHPHQQLDV